MGIRKILLMEVAKNVSFLKGNVFLSVLNLVEKTKEILFVKNMLIMKWIILILYGF